MLPGEKKSIRETVTGVEEWKGTVKPGSEGRMERPLPCQDGAPARLLTLIL